MPLRRLLAGLVLGLLAALGVCMSPANATIDLTWTRNYGTAASSAQVNSIATDTGGNTYIAGSFTGATLAFGGVTLTKIGDIDGFAVKLDSSGTVTWAKNFGGAGGNLSLSTIAVDGSNNVYLGGQFNTANLTTPAATLVGSVDALLLKLDSSGTTVWSRSYGAAGGSTLGASVAIDSAGNPFFSGTFTAALTTPALTTIGSTDTFVIKLDSSGSITWARNYGGPAGSTNSSGIAIDGSDNVFVTGYFSADLTTPTLVLIGSIDGYVIKIDSTGTTAWTRGINGAGSATYGFAAKADSSGNVYVAGRFSSSLTTPALTKVGTADGFVIRYDSSGSVALTQSFSGAGATVSPQSIAVDPSGNIYVSGAFQSAALTSPALAAIGSNDGFFLKLASTGTLVAAQNLGGATADLSRYAFRLAVDSSGTIYLGGGASGDLTTPVVTRIGAVDAVVIKSAGASETLTVTRAGTGSGTVTSSPSGISCGSTCSALFSTGASVTLTAAAATGSTFTGWSGDCSGSSTAASVTMSAARSCTASFATATSSGSTPPTWLGSSGTGELTFSSVEVVVDSSGRLSASIPAGNFNASDLTYTAMLADGSSLPSWLTFDPVTLTFSGTPSSSSPFALGRPAAAADAQAASGRWLATPPLKIAARLSIMLQVRDRQGQAATVTFPFVVYAQRTQATVVATSVTDAGVSGNGLSGAPALSDDGAALVFQSASTNLFGADINSSPDVVRYDVASGRLARFSTGSFTGSIAGPANGWSGAAAISADASTIAFASDAANIGLPWGNGVRQVWAADATRARVSTITPSPVAVSATAAGILADGTSDNPALSVDGRYVAFESEATNLVAGTDTAARRVYRKDRTTGAVVLVGSGRRAAISADGRYVAFDDETSVYRKDLTTGAQATVGTGTVARLSRDGRYLAFQTGGKAMRADLALGTTETVAADGSSPAISGDGRFVAYVAQGQIQVRDMIAGTTALVSTTTADAAGNGSSADPAISGDGRFIAFSSQATDLASNQSAGQLYLAGNPLLAPLASGWWWSSTEPGAGFAIETAGDRLLLGAFLYAADGTPVWYLGLGTLSATRASKSLDSYGGGQTLTGSYRAATLLGSAGTAEIAIASRTAASLSGAHTAGIGRYEFTTGGVTAGPQLGSPESGWWWNPEEPGTGWYLEVQSSSLFLAGFLYDDRGQASWVTSSGAMSSTRAFTGTLARCAGGQTLGGAHQAATCAGDLGTLTLAFSSPVAATLTLASGRQVALKRFRF